MENLDIIILSSIVTTLFIVFLITLYREFNTMGDTNYQLSKKEGPRGQLVNFIGNLMDDNKVRIIKAYLDNELERSKVEKPLADMESDGIYFPKDTKSYES